MWKPILLIFLVILAGVIGYSLIEDMSVMDSFYMTVITVFTVGFREVQVLTPAGQLFTIFIILGGVGTILFTVTKFGEIMYEGGMESFLWRKSMERQIKNLKDHYIICGHGRMGQTVRERLWKEEVPFVVIDKQEAQLSSLDQIKHCPYIQGDATQEEVLLQAGAKKAKALAALLPSDADNLYLTLTAKLINPSLFVLAKAMDDEAEQKIMQIGANKVVRPYKLGALRIAQGLMRPALADFVDIIIRRQELSLLMEEIVVPKEAKLVGRTLSECGIRQKANVIVVAIKKPGEDVVFNPSPGMEIQGGDTLLVLGDGNDIKKFEKQFIRAAT
jgi:voltage-gated potassium channel